MLITKDCEKDMPKDMKNPNKTVAYFLFTLNNLHHRHYNLMKFKTVTPIFCDYVRKIVWAMKLIAAMINIKMLNGLVTL
jgi:hypothetical protein